MTNYNPNPTDGLRGDRLLSEALASHTTDRHDGTDSGVYALRCCSPGDTVEEHHRRWRDYYDVVPETIDRLASADQLAYVGAASNVRARLEDHISGDVRQAAFTTVYPPYSIVSVTWTHNTDAAFERELRVAFDLSDTCTVWCNGALR